MSDLSEIALKLVVDGSTVYVVEKTVLEPALRPLLEFAKSILFPRWDAAREEVRRQVSEAFASCQAGDDQFFERLQRSFQAGEADALITRLTREAAQATTEERMRMLAAAAAGLLTPDLNSEMRSRVARAVEQLEPSDVLALRQASTVAGNLQQIPGYPENGAALLRTGCLLEASGIGYRSKYEVTALARAVLSALQTWTESSGSSARP